MLPVGVKVPVVCAAAVEVTLNIRKRGRNAPTRGVQIRLPVDFTSSLQNGHHHPIGLQFFDFQIQL
jgi:hypothetical protein